MDKTNYTVLSVVAIVAITAIVAIFIHAKAPQGVSLGEAATTARAVLSLPLTGQVVADGPNDAPAPSGNALDLNDDGVIDKKDSQILGLVVDRVQFCPRNKRCDVDGNTVVDIYDLAALNARILEQSVPLDTTSAPAQDYDEALIAATGVIG